MNRFSRAQRGAFAGGVLAALMVLMLAVTPASSVLADVVSQFRTVKIQRIQAITIPMDLAQLGASAQSASSIDPSMVAALTGQFQGLGTPSSTLDQNSVTTASSIGDARSQFTGGDLFVPQLDNASKAGAFANTQPANIYLTKSAGSFSYQLDTAKVSQLFQQFGVGTDWLTTSDPTVTFRFDVQPIAVMEWEQNGKHLVVGQTLNPTLNVPTGVDLDTLRNDLLSNQLVGAALGPDLKAQLQGVTDWQHTLIIPVPSDAKTTQVAVRSVNNEQNGLLIESAQGKAVIWLEGGQDGTLHVLASDDTSVDVLALAQAAGA